MLRTLIGADDDPPEYEVRCHLDHLQSHHWRNCWSHAEVAHSGRGSSFIVLSRQLSQVRPQHCTIYREHDAMSELLEYHPIGEIKKYVFSISSLPVQLRLFILMPTQSKQIIKSTRSVSAQIHQKPERVSSTDGQKAHKDKKNVRIDRCSDVASPNLYPPSCFLPYSRFTASPVGSVNGSSFDLI